MRAGQQLGADFALLHQGGGGFEAGHFAGFEAQVGRAQKLGVDAVLPAQHAQAVAGVHGLLVAQAHLPAQFGLHLGQLRLAGRQCGHRPGRRRCGTRRAGPATGVMVNWLSRFWELYWP